jgi:glycosyltransferase involved in cell wall biosynthesis
MDQLNNFESLQGAMPEVDVIIPFHVVNDYLLESISSVRNSRMVKVHIIAVNDTLDEVNPSQIGLRDQDILLKSEVKGYIGALATGVYASSSEFIAFQDSDDFTDPERLIKQIEFLYKNKVDLVAGKLMRTNKIGKFIDTEPIFGNISDSFPLRLKLVLGPHGADSSILGKRLIIQKHWVKHSNFTTSFSDYGWLLTLQGSIKIGFCKDAVYFYRSHNEQLSRSTSDVIGWNDVFPVWLENFRDTFSEVIPETNMIYSQLIERPLVGLCIAFPSSLPKLTKSDRYVLKMVIDWITERNTQQNYELIFQLKETLYRRGFIGTRGRALRFWPAGLKMLYAMLRVYFKGVKPRLSK